MKKKGFTLVELLAVIAILAILMLLIMPNVIKMFNQGKEDAFKVQVGNIVKAAQMQKQSDSFEGKNYYVYCLGANGSCTKDLSISTTDGDVNYSVIFDTNNNVKSVGVSDSNYCYVNNSYSSDVDSYTIYEGASLSCTSDTCRCIGGENGDKYVYWKLADGGSNVSYTLNSTPSTTYNSIEAMNPDSYETFVRTTLDSSNNAKMHEVCYYFEGKVFCMGYNYFVPGDVDGSLTAAKLERELRSLYGSHLTSCYTTYDTSNDTPVAQCSFAKGHLRALKNGYVHVGANGKGLCARNATKAYCKS